MPRAAVGCRYSGERVRRLNIDAEHCAWAVQRGAGYGSQGGRAAVAGDIKTRASAKEVAIVFLFI